MVIQYNPDFYTEKEMFKEQAPLFNARSTITYK